MNTTPEPVVFIVDDDEAVRKFICKLIRSVGLECEAYETAQAFLQDGHFERPGCLVLDIRMPEMSGLQLQQELARRQIVLPTIFLTGHGNVQVAVHTMKAGAVDFIEKPFNNEILLDRVQSAVKLSIEHQRDNREKMEILRCMDSLSVRERQVLELVVQGLTNKLMADHLNVSEKTIEHHRARVMGKMNAGSLSELIKMAAKAGLEGL